MSEEKHKAINKAISGHSTPLSKATHSIENEEIFRRMFEDNNVAMLLYEPSTGQILDANPSAIRFYGYSREKFLSLRVQDLYAIPPEEFFAKLLEMAAQGFTGNVKASHKLANGETREVEVHTTPIITSGKVINFSIICDATNKTRDQQENTSSSKHAVPIEKKIEEGPERGNILEKASAANEETKTNLPIPSFEGSTPREISPKLESKSSNTGNLSHIIQENTVADDEKLFRLIAENTSAAVFIYQDDKIFYVNAACVQMLGYDKSELIGKNFWEIIHPDFRDLEKELGIARQRGENVPSHYEVKLIKKSGKELWVDLTAYVINYGNKPTVFTTVFDTTAQRSARQELEEREEHYRTLIDISPDAVMVQSEGKIIYLNQAATKLLGIDSPEKAVGKSITEFVHPRSIPAVTSFFDTVAKSYRRAELSDEKFLRPDGTSFDAELVSAPIMYFDKPAYEVIVRDVTNRKHAIEQLRLQSIALNTAANAIVITDRNGIIIWANRAFEKLTGYTPSEFLNNKIGNIVRSGKHDEKFYKDLWETILSGKTWHNEIINRRKDGSLYTEDMTITPVMDESGTITNFVAIKQDITESKMLEEQIIQTQKLESIGELAGGVAHDYNNILGVILGYAELLKRKLGDDSRAHQSIEAILAATRRGTDLTKQLLAFAQKGMISPEVLNINSVIESILGILQRIVGENIKIDFIPDRNLWNVKIDPSQLNQMLADLAANARDAIEKTGTITIKTSNVELDELYARLHVGFATGKYVLLTFSDTGKGMDQETLERVFEPFFTTKPKGQAKGLGLSTVYGIVKRCKGNITVSSKPGAGTTFNIYLPRFYEENVNMGASFSDELLMGTETILVVEDQADLLQLVKANLEELGYKVMTAISPNEALLLSKTYPSTIHLLLTDVIMPTMSGKELSDEITKTRPEIKTIFMSGYSANVLAPRGVLNKGIHFLQKPFTFDELAKKVREVLKSKV
jgi:two-component system cell cycle sensor histidine kinase/response regulator CckA